MAHHQISLAALWPKGPTVGGILWEHKLFSWCLAQEPGDASSQKAGVLPFLGQQRVVAQWGFSLWSLWVGFAALAEGKPYGLLVTEGFGGTRQLAPTGASAGSPLAMEDQLV